MPIYSRQAVVDLALSWVGKKESDGSHKEIIDIYNSHKPLPRGTKMQYDWAWCACAWSALGIKLGYTDIWPLEISVPKLQVIAQSMGIWVENDGYIPHPGDGILYDWADAGKGDNVGSPDHVGVVTYVNEDTGYFEVVEGNYSNACKKRTVSINGRYIRGFIVPKYTDSSVAIDKGTVNSDVITVAREVIAGKWGTGAVRKARLTEAGYDASEIQMHVNYILNFGVSTANTTRIMATEKAMEHSDALSGSFVTTANLFLRNGAGTDRKSLNLMPKGATVENYGYFTTRGNVRWYYVNYSVGNTMYTGFCHGGYLRRKEA